MSDEKKENHIESVEDYQAGWADGYADGETDGILQQSQIAQEVLDKWEKIIQSEENNTLIIRDFCQALKAIADNGNNIMESEVEGWDG